MKSLRASSTNARRMSSRGIRGDRPLLSAAPRVNQFCSIITIALTLGCNGERREDDSLAVARDIARIYVRARAQEEKVAARRESSL